jgi:small multidrug resistance pump
MKHSLLLLLAIILETAATMSLKESKSFTKLWPSLITLVGYGSAFYLLSHTLTRMNVGTVYAIWCGVGMVLIALMGVFFYKEKLDLAAWIGIGMVMAGVLCITLFSNTHYVE